jgi:Rho family protein
MLSAQGQVPITPEHGAAVAKDIGAHYKECSAKTGKGVKEVFDAALRESLRGKWGRTIHQRKCLVM